MLINLAYAYLYCLHMQSLAFPQFISAHIDDMEQNVNTARMIADSDYDDLDRMIPEKINPSMWRL